MIADIANVVSAVCLLTALGVGAVLAVRVILFGFMEGVFGSPFRKR